MVHAYLNSHFSIQFTRCAILQRSIATERLQLQETLWNSRISDVSVMKCNVTGTFEHQQVFHNDALDCILR